MIRFFHFGILFLLIFLSLDALAQKKTTYDPNHLPNDYRSSANPYYWKNRLPFPGYWQQDVYYRIQASLNDQTDVISGHENLTYWNNSPDTLTYVYFHLYQNAFGPSAYYSDLTRNNHQKVKYGAYEAEDLGTTVEGIKENGLLAKTALDNTILKVWLSKPLLPGQSVDFEMEFKTYFDGGSNRRRMKLFNSFGYKHYDGVHWYPRISVYDRKFGWTADQHLTKEFYGDYGTYDVDLELPTHYVLEATGLLQNKSEAMPDSLRAQLDISHFLDKPWNSKPSVVIPADGTTKHWKFYAENVHDFAWTADPTYRIGDTKWNGISIISIVQEPHASGWFNAATYTAAVVKTYSQDFGMYIYPKMVVCDAQDGMEYPMLTLDGGSDPSYRGLLAHEVGHNWFFGMVGNNETYRAMLDEGFTQFLTAWCERKLDGELVPGDPSNLYDRTFYKAPFAVDDEVYWGYQKEAMAGERGTLNTHSDHFNSALGHGGGYGKVYYKTSAMLYALQYTLGDSLFLAAMQHYVAQWKVCHPYVEDFRNTIIHYTHVDLNWFFDEWIETNQTCDYAVGCVRRKKGGNYTINLKRKGEMEMPVDLAVVSKNGDTTLYQIPNRNFSKTKPTTILPKWFGWGLIASGYQAKIQLPGKVKNVIIDPSNRMGDINLLNNSSKFPLKFRFESHAFSYPNRYAYDLRWRPDVWYNQVDGLKAGLHLEGDYFQMRRLFSFTLWYNTGVGAVDSLKPKSMFGNGNLPFSYAISYNTKAANSSKTPGIELYSQYLDGLEQYKIGTSHYFGKGAKLQATANFMYRYVSTNADGANNLNYLLYPNAWTANSRNISLTLLADKNYNYAKGSGTMAATLRTPLPFSEKSYYTLSLKNINEISMSKLNFRLRLFAQLGFGDFPLESMLYAASANPEEMSTNKYYRASIYYPVENKNYGSTIGPFQMGGGLNLRGYNGYAMPFVAKDGITYATYRGTSGASANAEIRFDRFWKLHPKLTKNWLSVNLYVFGDAGTIDYKPFENKGGFSFIRPRLDGGAGALLIIKKFGPLRGINPLVLRADFPVYVSDAPFGDKNNLQFRWIVGIGRSF